MNLHMTNLGCKKWHIWLGYIVN